MGFSEVSVDDLPVELNPANLSPEALKLVQSKLKEVITGNIVNLLFDAVTEARLAELRNAKDSLSALSDFAVQRGIATLTQ
jgi:hypothetical protein